MMRPSLAAYTIFSASLICCLVARVVLANTDVLEYIHRAAYPSSSTRSNFNASGGFLAEERSPSCLDPIQDENVEDNSLWLAWIWGECSVLLSAIVEWYTVSLETNPVITKSFTSAIMGALGDIVAQSMEMWTNGGAWERRRLCLRRVFSIGAEGFFVSGPLMHFSYEFLEELLPIFAEDDGDPANDLHSWCMSICQVIIDMIVMDSIFVATMMITSALLEGRGREIPQEMTSSYVPAVKVSWFNSLCWAPVQCISFKYIHVNYRVLAINMQDIAWNASVSYMTHRSRRLDPDDTDEKGIGGQQRVPSKLKTH